jgi:RNA polymerase sigma-70 factor (ECF subfamily)
LADESKTADRKSQDEAAESSPSSSATNSTTFRLLEKIRRGDNEALGTLIGHLLPSLNRWARGRLPAWARHGNDTADLVQDAVLKALPHLDRFEPRRRKALRTYLQMSVRNRIRDEIRRADVRDAGASRVDVPPPPPSPFEALARSQQQQRYSAGLARLSAADRELVVARVEMGWSYEQIAFVTERKSADAARMAIKRAIQRLAEAMLDDA